MKITKYKEGEKVWQRNSISGRDAVDCLVRTLNRIEKRGYFAESGHSKGGKNFIVVNAGDNALVFTDCEASQ
jgi:hypothetical protein